jgi:hypothetical protein
MISGLNTLPIASEAESMCGMTPYPPLASMPASILVAEDPFVSSFLRAILTKKGHKVVTGEALRLSALLSQGTLAADIVITNRPDAFLQLASTQPVLYIAANPDPNLARQFSACRMLRKPFRNDELLLAVEELAHHAVR